MRVPVLIRVFVLDFVVRFWKLEIFIEAVLRFGLIVEIFSICQSLSSHFHHPLNNTFLSAGLFSLRSELLVAWVENEEGEDASCL